MNIDIAAKLPELGQKYIVVVGDMILDRYRILRPKKLSPEAPVLIFEPEAEELKAGGAGNVAANLIDLGVGKVKLATVLGLELANQAEKLMSDPIYVIETDRKTTVKERLVTRRQQLARIDIQSNEPISLDSAKTIVSVLRNEIAIADALVFSDYDHGVCIADLVRPILEQAIERKIPIIVDSKSRDSLSKYKGATIASPNMDEAKMITKLDEFQDEDVAKFLLKTMGLKAAAITLGPRGIMLATTEKTEIFPPLHPNINQEVIDVTGAGDTVAATIAAGMTLGMEYSDIMELANITAGIKVQKRGVATASPREILDAMENKHGRI